MVILRLTKEGNHYEHALAVDNAVEIRGSVLDYYQENPVIDKKITKLNYVEDLVTSANWKEEDDHNLISYIAPN